jgi:hypothetical protein
MDIQPSSIQLQMLCDCSESIDANKDKLHVSLSWNMISVRPVLGGLHFQIQQFAAESLTTLSANLCLRVCINNIKLRQTCRKLARRQSESLVFDFIVAIGFVAFRMSRCLT